MTNNDLERRLATSAPPGPDPALRGRVLSVIGDELRQRIPAIDRVLARRLPWTSTAALLLAILIALRAQVVADDRARADRLQTAASERAVRRVAGDVSAFVEDARAEAWVRGRILAQASIARDSTRAWARWLRAQRGDDPR